MKRMIGTVAVLLAATVVAIAGTGADEPASDNPTYWVEFDNAFGLVEDADLKIAGVRAGKIKSMKLDRNAKRALVEVEVAEQGFGALRADAFCETRPQSLIGEYFVDCQPGSSPVKLRDGGRIPVAQTGSTVPVDLVTNIMRRPYRERFTILLNELGTGLAGRGEDLDATIRRAVPALRAVDRVLAQLATQRQTIARLYRDADRVVGELAANRADINRFVAEARDTSGITASRREALRGQFQRLPTFLRELRAVAVPLGVAADEQYPVLRNLNNNAGRLKVFLDTLRPFADAARPATRSLAAAARAGRPAVTQGRPAIRELARFAGLAPETANNLSRVLTDLDSRARAVEKDPRSPGGQGYTGLEAVLRYVFAQSQAINLFDANSYILKVSPFLDNLCAQYTNAAQAKDPARNRCAARLGPSRPGINSPDPTARSAPAAAAASRSAAPGAAQDLAGLTPAATAPAPGPGGAPATPGNPSGPLDDLLSGVDRTLGGVPGQTLGGAGGSPRSSADLLDFLMAP